MKKLIIAIDGPSASGKSTTAKLLAKKLDYTYLDTGAMYRCLTLAALNTHTDVNSEEAIKDLLDKTDIKVDKSTFYVNDIDVSKEIRNNEVTKNVSVVCAYPPVRKEMANRQREIGKNGGVILDGRDIGTYVFPNAEVKFFQTASVEVRAERRFKENQIKGFSGTLEEIKEDLIRRDKHDSSRALAPLKQADDAILIDTSNLTVDEVVNKMYDIVKKKESGE